VVLNWGGAADAGNSVCLTSAETIVLCAFCRLIRLSLPNYPEERVHRLPSRQAVLLQVRAVNALRFVRPHSAFVRIYVSRSQAYTICSTYALAVRYVCAHMFS
jgi:hypothetical protein